MSTRGTGVPSTVHSRGCLRLAFGLSGRSNFWPPIELAVVDTLRDGVAFTLIAPSLRDQILSALRRDASTPAAPAPRAPSPRRAPGSRWLKFVGMRLLPGRRALIGRHRRVALDQTHAIERHAQLFGDELRLRGVEALPELALAGVGRHRAVGGDRDPRVELRAAGPVEALRQHAAQAIRNAGRREASRSSAPEPLRNARREKPAPRRARAAASAVSLAVIPPPPFA